MCVCVCLFVGGFVFLCVRVDSAFNYGLIKQGWQEGVEEATSWGNFAKISNASSHWTPLCSTTQCLRVLISYNIVLLGSISSNTVFVCSICLNTFKVFTVSLLVIQCFDIISSSSRDHLLGNLNFIPFCFCSFFCYFLYVYTYGNKCYYLLCEIHPSCTINFLCYNNNAIVTQRKLCWVPPFLHTKEYKHPLKYLSR